MARFRSELLAELTRQLAFAPPAQQRTQMQHAELLYWEIEPDQQYPFDFVVWRLTRYRPEGTEVTLLIGQDIRDDLLMLVDQLSDGLSEPADDYDPPPLDIAAAARQLHVSAKTIHRYRKIGLFSRHFVFGDGRGKVGLLPASIDRFVASQSSKLQSAARFSRLDEQARQTIITRARRIASRVQVSPYRVARHLAGKYHRSPESIRQLLLHHDQADPRFAIFPDHVAPLSARRQRVIYRAYQRGVPVGRMAQRYGKTRDALYRVINLRRAEALRQMDIRCIANATFEYPDADAVILYADEASPSTDTDNDDQSTDAARDEPLDLSGLPSYLQHLSACEPVDPQTEQTLFVRYNYLKHRADKRRQTLDRHQPRARDLDLIETDLRWARQIKQRLARVNLRLVVSVARGHLTDRAAAGRDAITDLIGEGNLVLLHAIETFDTARGNRFSTYVSWALMRQFASLIGQRHGRAGRMRMLDEVNPDLWPRTIQAPLTALEQAEAVEQTLPRLLDQLNEREHLVLIRRHGLVDRDGQQRQPQTLGEVAAEMGVSPERVRQIEHRAMVKLRRAAARIDRAAGHRATGDGQT